MPPAIQYEIPKEISNDDELKAWYEQELEKLGDEPPLQKEYELLETVSRFYQSPETKKNCLFDQAAFNYYRGPLVSALMAKGWEIKRGDQKYKKMRFDAIQFFRKALILIPENPKAYYRLGHLMKTKGKIGEAVGSFSKALELASKQADFQKDLKLNDAQIVNACGQSIALLQGLMGSFELDIEFTFDPEQITTLQNLVRDTYDRHVVYSIKVGGSIETKTIDSYEYDDIIRNLKWEPKAFIIDRYNQVSQIRYLDEIRAYEHDTQRSGKLNYLLKAIGLEQDWEPPSVRPNSITQNVRRVNDGLKDIGVNKWVEIAYSQTEGGSIFSPKCDLTVHYFKSLLY